MYWTVIVPWVPREFQTEWHPRDEEKGGSFDPLTCGAFKTEGEAIAWARDHLGGTPYYLREQASPEALETLVRRARKLNLDRFLESLSADEQHEIALSGAAGFGAFWGEATDQ